MPISTPQAMFACAMDEGYALPAFNVFSIEGILAVLDGAEAQRSPVIMQVSMGARRHVEHLAPFVETIRAFAARYAVPVYIQHDHCPSVQACREAIDAGVQGVMFDGSHLPFEENIACTQQVVSYARNQGVWVEAELGRIPGSEDDVHGEEVEYTDPALAREFIERSGCNALAVAVGTSHGGVQSDDYLPFNFDRLQKIHECVGRFPLVLHGAASLPPELIDACNSTGGEVRYLRNCSESDIAKSVDGGIRKINMDVDNFLLYTTRVRAYLREHPDVYDPRKYTVEGKLGFQEEVEHKLACVSHSAGYA